MFSSAVKVGREDHRSREKGVGGDIELVGNRRYKDGENEEEIYLEKLERRKRWRLRDNRG